VGSQVTTTHDDNATTWRDLADQLTLDQLTWMELFERDALGDPGEVSAVLLDAARGHSRQNLEDDALFGHLSTPAGARKVFHWEDDGTGHWSRRFAGTERGVELPSDSRFRNKADVDIEGVQHADGSIERAVYVNANGVELTAAAARDLAATLIAAADEADQLNS
jgi:hypothetical protein